MKINTFLLSIFYILFLSSFNTSDRACEYVSSNIEFITSQTKRALSQTNFDKTKFETYKAINAIEKTKSKLNDCGCTYASKNLMEALDNLINATKISTHVGAKIFLSKALENSTNSLELLQLHHTHESKYQHDKLSLNTKALEEEKSKKQNASMLRQTIDNSLKKFEASVDKIVTTTDCDDAKEYLIKVQESSENELLNEKLTEGKKYYNLRTKAIATEALKKLDCN